MGIPAYSSVSNFTEFIVYVNHTTVTGIRTIVHSARKSTEKLADFKLLMKVSHAALNALALIPPLQALGKIADLFKRIQNFISYISDIKEIDELLTLREAGKELPWHKVATHIAKLVITIFTTIDYVAAVKGTATAVHEFFSSIPFMGVLRFGGITGAIDIVISAYDIIEAIHEYRKLGERDVKILEKIAYWEGVRFQPEVINDKIRQLNEKITEATNDILVKKLKTKKEKFETIRDADKDKRAVYIRAKVTKWEHHKLMNPWEKKTKIATGIAKTFKIATKVFNTAMLFTGFGAVAVPFIEAGTHVLDALPDIAKYYFKRKIYKITPEKVSIETLGTSAA